MNMKRKATDNAEDPSKAPDYGSKSYWESRYKRSGSSSHPPENTDKNDTKKDGNIDNATEDQGGHAWYFTYEELRPLILGLLVDQGDANSITVEDYVNNDDGDDDSWEEAEPNSNDEGDNEDTEKQNDSDCNSDNSDRTVDLLEVYLTQTITRESSKSILEIGCGDVPLGSSITSELNKLQSSTGCDARMVVNSVECIDYSSVVIDDLKKQQNAELQSLQQDQQPKAAAQGNNFTPIHPKYSTLDARCLPHASNSISLVLEKGTLDAMLSHPEEGTINSIAVVKEMARVVKIGGAILIVSHLNARSDKGMSWVNDVLLIGLRDEWLERKKNGDQNSNQIDNDKKSNNKIHDLMDVLWSIEVHGGEPYNDCEHDNGCDGKVCEAVDEEEDTEPDYGPAVYILKKLGVPPTIFKQVMKRKKKNPGDDEDMPPVKLEFLTY